MTVKMPEYLEESINTMVDDVFRRIQGNIPEEVEDLFISIPPRTTSPDSYILWVFTKLYIVRVWNPSNVDRIQHDMAYLANCVDWVELDARKFDFVNSESSSRMRLEFTTTDGFSGELWGQGKGCDHLMTIYRERFIKNFYPPEANTAEWYRRG